MTNPICPQFSPALLIPIGIENQSTRTMAHAYNSFGLSRDGSLPKAIHEGGAADVDGTQHFIQYPAGNKIPLSFEANLLSKDRPSLKCFEAAIGFDRKHYEDRKDSVDQSTPLARFYQDQILEVWDPVLEAKTNAKETGPVVYKDLLKFWDGGIGDANTSTLNLATLRAVLEHIEKPNEVVTVDQLIADHDQGVSLSLTKGGLVCGASDMGRKFDQGLNPEYNLACAKPTDPNAALGTLGFKDHTAVSNLELAESKKTTEFYQKMSWGLGSSLGLVALILGIRAIWRARNKPAPVPTPPERIPAPSPSPAPVAASKASATASSRAVEFHIGKEPGEKGGVSGFTLSNLPVHVAKGISRDHLLVRVEGDRYLVQEIGVNAGTATIERAGTRLRIPRMTDDNPWIELTRGDAIDIAGAVRLPFSGAPDAGASPTGAFTLEVIAPGTPFAAPAVAPALAAAPVRAAAAPKASAAPLSKMDRALDSLDEDVVATEVPNVATITKEAIEHQIRFLFPELDIDRHDAIVHDLADEALHRLQNMGGEEFRTEFQHEIASYRDVIRGAGPTRFLIKVVEDRLEVHRRMIAKARADELIRIAEDDRAHAGRREELKEVFRRSMESAREAAKGA